LKRNAEQWDWLDRWRLILSRALQKFLQGKYLLAPNGCRKWADPPINEDRLGDLQRLSRENSALQLPFLGSFIIQMTAPFAERMLQLIQENRCFYKKGMENR